MTEYTNQTYRLIEGALPGAVCDAILTTFTNGADAEVHSPLKGSRVDPTSRRSSVQFLENDHWVAGLLRHLIWQANEQVWNFDLHSLQIVQLTDYDMGDFFSWHKDTGDGPIGADSRKPWQGMVRKLSVTLLLSHGDEFEGGDLQIKDEYGHVWRDPGFRERGAGVVFPSHMLHQVTPVNKGRRRSAVAWALGPPLR